MAKKNKKNSHSSEVKLAVCKAYVEGEFTAEFLAKEVKAHPQTVYGWIRKYKKEGEDAFDEFSPKQIKLLKAVRKAAAKK